MRYNECMNSELSNLVVVPRQTRPAKINKSVRLRPWLLEQVEAICADKQLTFSDAIERALEDWVKTNG